MGYGGGRDATRSTVEGATPVTTDAPLDMTAGPDEPFATPERSRQPDGNRL
jgi:hypothetical protein